MLRTLEEYRDSEHCISWASFFYGRQQFFFFFFEQLQQFFSQVGSLLLYSCCYFCTFTHYDRVICNSGCSDLLSDFFPKLPKIACFVLSERSCIVLFLVIDLPCAYLCVCFFYPVCDRLSCTQLCVCVCVFCNVFAIGSSRLWLLYVQSETCKACHMEIVPF